MTRKILAACLGCVLLGLAVVITVGFRPAARLLQGGLPAQGWSVCLVGGLESIPGVGERQVFELCQGDGWRVRVYCLDPNQPAPAQGDRCSLLGGDTFWCGDGVQQLQYFAMLETPAPVEVSPTATFTATVTAIATATVTATTTATASATAAATAAPAQETATPTPRSTPYERPRAGGQGNLPFFLAGLALAGMVTLAGFFGAWLLRHRGG